MTKHEEAKSFLCLLPAKLKDFYSNYITEQEKKDELLELYRELVKLDKSIRITMIDIEKYNLFKKMTKVRQQIKALEEEMK